MLVRQLRERCLRLGVAHVTFTAFAQQDNNAVSGCITAALQSGSTDTALASLSVEQRFTALRFAREHFGEVIDTLDSEID